MPNRLAQGPLLSLVRKLSGKCVGLRLESVYNGRLVPQITMVWPPSCFIATSKLMRVRVERLSNTIASERPDKICGGENFCFFSVCALARIPFSVSLGISERSMKCLTSFFIALLLFLTTKIRRQKISSLRRHSLVIVANPRDSRRINLLSVFSPFFPEKFNHAASLIE